MAALDESSKLVNVEDPETQERALIWVSRNYSPHLRSTFEFELKKRPGATVGELLAEYHSRRRTGIATANRPIEFQT